MKITVETYSGRDEMGGLYLELGRILMRIHRKWQQADQEDEILTKASVLREEMETVIIPADDETVRQTDSPEEEVMETVILSPSDKEVPPAERTLEALCETLIIPVGNKADLHLNECTGSAAMETVLHGQGLQHAAQPSLSNEDCLDETIILPPAKDRLKRREVR